MKFKENSCRVRHLHTCGHTEEESKVLNEKAKRKKGRDEEKY